MSEEISAQQHLDTARADRIAGKINDTQFYEIVDRYGPQLDAPRSATPAEHAGDQLRDLRQRRIDGKIDDASYYRELDRLGPVAHADAVSMDWGGTHVTMSGEAAAQLEAALDPPASPNDYRFEATHYQPGDRAVDDNVRQALHTLGIPTLQATYAVETVEKLAARFDGADESTIKAHTTSVTETLRQRWGDSFGARMDAVIDALAAIEGPLGDAIEARPHIVADPLLLTQLDAALTRRAARKK